MLKEAQFKTNYTLDYVDLGLNKNQLLSALSNAPLKGTYRVVENLLLLDNPNDAQMVFKSISASKDIKILGNMLEYLQIFEEN